MIETTANIDRETYQMIKGTARKLRVPQWRLVHCLLKTVGMERPFKNRLFRTVEYQDYRPEGDWVCYHLRLVPEIYEKSHDVRRLVKFSVSFLLCYAVRIYLEKAVQLLEDNTDNYPEDYKVFTIHTKKISTFTVFHTPPDPQDLPRHFTHPEEYT